MCAGATEGNLRITAQVFLEKGLSNVGARWILLSFFAREAN